MKLTSTFGASPPEGRGFCLNSGGRRSSAWAGARGFTLMEITTVICLILALIMVLALVSKAYWTAETRAACKIRVTSMNRAMSALMIGREFFPGDALPVDFVANTELLAYLYGDSTADAAARQKAVGCPDGVSPYDWLVGPGGHLMMPLVSNDTPLDIHRGSDGPVDPVDPGLFDGPGNPNSDLMYCYLRYGPDANGEGTTTLQAPMDYWQDNPDFWYYHNGDESLIGKPVLFDAWGYFLVYDAQGNPAVQPAVSEWLQDLGYTPEQRAVFLGPYDSTGVPFDLNRWVADPTEPPEVDIRYYSALPYADSRMWGLYRPEWAGLPVLNYLTSYGGSVEENGTSWVNCEYDASGNPIPSSDPGLAPVDGWDGTFVTLSPGEPNPDSPSGYGPDVETPFDYMAWVGGDHSPYTYFPGSVVPVIPTDEPPVDPHLNDPIIPNVWSSNPSASFYNAAWVGRPVLYYDGINADTGESMKFQAAYDSAGVAVPQEGYPAMVGSSLYTYADGAYVSYTGGGTPPVDPPVDNGPQLYYQVWDVALGGAVSVPAVYVNGIPQKDPAYASDVPTSLDAEWVSLFGLTAADTFRYADGTAWGSVPPGGGNTTVVWSSDPHSDYYNEYWAGLPVLYSTFNYPGLGDYYTSRAAYDDNGNPVLSADAANYLKVYPTSTVSYTNPDGSAWSGVVTAPTGPPPVVDTTVYPALDYWTATVGAPYYNPAWAGLPVLWYERVPGWGSERAEYDLAGNPIRAASDTFDMGSTWTPLFKYLGSNFRWNTWTGQVVPPPTLPDVEPPPVIPWVPLVSSPLDLTRYPELSQTAWDSTTGKLTVPASSLVYTMPDYRAEHYSSADIVYGDLPVSGSFYTNPDGSQYKWEDLRAWENSMFDWRLANWRLGNSNFGGPNGTDIGSSPPLTYMWLHPDGTAFKGTTDEYGNPMSEVVDGAGHTYYMTSTIYGPRSTASNSGSEVVYDPATGRAVWSTDSRYNRLYLECDYDRDIPRIDPNMPTDLVKTLVWEPTNTETYARPAQVEYTADGKILMPNGTTADFAYFVPDPRSLFNGARTQIWQPEQIKLIEEDRARHSARWYAWRSGAVQVYNSNARSYEEWMSEYSIPPRLRAQWVGVATTSYDYVPVVSPNYGQLGTSVGVVRVGTEFKGGSMDPPVPSEPTVPTTPTTPTIPTGSSVIPEDGFFVTCTRHDWELEALGFKVPDKGPQPMTP